MLIGACNRLLCPFHVFRYVWPPPAAADAVSRYGLPSMSKDDVTYIAQDYWRGRVWTPMLQLVYWGLAEYPNSTAARGAADGLTQQSKALLLREWFGYDSNNDYAGKLTAGAPPRRRSRLCQIVCRFPIRV